MEKQFIVKKESLDPEWVELILDAFDLGMSVEEIKDYFSKKRYSS